MKKMIVSIAIAAALAASAASAAADGDQTPQDGLPSEQISLEAVMGADALDGIAVIDSGNLPLDPGETSLDQAGPELRAPISMTVERDGQVMSLAQADFLKPGDKISVLQTITNMGKSEIAGEAFTYDIPEGQDLVAGSITLERGAKLETAGSDGIMAESTAAGIGAAVRSFTVTLVSLAPGQTTEIGYVLEVK